MVRQGYHTGGVPAYGYRSETVPGMQPTLLAGGKVKPPPKRLVPDQTEAEQVVRAFELYAETSNMGSVRKYLRQVAPERTWTIDTVRRMLTNEKYIGVARFGQNTNPEAHPAIIEADLWERVQAALTEKATLRTDPRAVGYDLENRKDDFTYYLRGLVLCSVCGCRMTPAAAHGKTGKVHYYQCTKAMKNGSDCPVKRVNAATLHSAILGEIQRCAEHPSRLIRLYESVAKNLPSPSETREEIKQAKRNQRETDKKIARLVAAIRDGGSSAALNKEVRQLEALGAEQDTKIAEGQARLGSLSAPRPDSAALAALWGDFSCRWQQLSLEERTLLLGCLADHPSFFVRGWSGWQGPGARMR
jgi:hypothetical protein